MFNVLCPHIKARNFFRIQYFANLLIFFNLEPHLGACMFANSDL